jgi:hypothetical protein
VDSRQAHRILRSLIDGADPMTGAEIPLDSLLHNGNVLRALLHGAEALQEKMRRSERRASLPDNVGKPWADPEHDELLSAYTSGATIPELAIKHGRTERGIQSRLATCGVLRPEDSRSHAAFDERGSSAGA